MKELLDFGVVIIDKPKGPTSHQVSAWVRDILKIKKTGHGGTLDPDVTGVLPVALNRATKIINILHLAPKEYVGVMHLHKDVDENKIREVFEEFRGEIYQIPPVRAAVARRLRKRKIYELEIMEIDGRYVLFRAKVESGTYIRALCRDIGDALCTGANMEDLRRIATGHFTEEDAISLTELLDAYKFWEEDGDDEYLKKIIRKGDEIVSFLPKIIVKDSAVDSLAHGAPLYESGIIDMGEINEGDVCALYTKKNELISVSKVILKDKIVANPIHVIIERGKYPSTWKRARRLGD